MIIAYSDFVYFLCFYVKNLIYLRFKRVKLLGLYFVPFCMFEAKIGRIKVVLMGIGVFVVILHIVCEVFFRLNMVNIC